MGMTDFSKSPVLNKIKSFFSGNEPAQGQMQQRVTAYHRGYGGSFGGGVFSDGSKYAGGISGSGCGINFDHYTLRQNARVAMQDSPQGRAIVERKVDGIAHTGLRCEFTPDAQILGITQEAAAEWGKDVSARLHLWASDKKQHRSETMTWYQSHWLYTWFKERDNDIFERLYYSPDRNLQNPLQFEFLDPDQIRGQEFTSTYGMLNGSINGHANASSFRNTGNGSNGIIYDDRGREVGYQVWVKQKNGTVKQVDIMAKGPKSGRIFMLHGFRPEYAGQGRGFTKLAPILQELQKLSDFTQAQITQAITQSAITGWITSKDEDATPVFSADRGGAGAGAIDSATVSEDCDTALTTSEFECQNVPTSSINKPGVFIQGLAKNNDIKFANSSNAINGYDKFLPAFVESLAAVSGMSREYVSKKFGSNYAANRATLLLTQLNFEIERADMAADNLNPTKEMWLSGEIAAGRVTAPGWSDPRLKAAWLKCVWRGTGVPDIDPAKLANAREKNTILGVTNAEIESQQHSGTSAIDNIAANNAIYANYQQLPFSQNFAIEAGDDDVEEEN